MPTDRLEDGAVSLPPPDTTTLVVGAKLAAGIANRLPTGVVRLLTDDPRAASRADDRVAVTVGDPTDLPVLRRALEAADVVVVAPRRDARALLVARLAATEGCDRVYAVVEDPENVGLFLDAEVRPICATDLVAGALVRTAGADR